MTAEQVAAPTVATTHGPLLGRWQGTVAVFHRVPYAAPPVGQRRFVAPQPPAPWQEIRDASEAGPAAPQPPSVLEAVLGAEHHPTDEGGCLTLSVWTPEPGTGRRPVLVWLHGGAFLSGFGSGPRQDAGRLAGRRDVVVVSVNSRLGALGFLAVGDPQGSEDTVNRGLLDQAAALAWVRANAAAFGGDPTRIVLGGHSSGALCALALAASPHSAGVVTGLFLASPRLGDLATPGQAFEQARTYAEVLGLGDDAGPEAVRAVPADRLVAASAEMVRRLGAPAPQLVSETAAIPVPPTASVAGDGLPVTVGTTRDEAHAFGLASGASSPSAEQVRCLLRTHAPDPDATHAFYSRRRPGARPADVLADALTDAWFRVPVLQWAGDRRGRTHLYRFDWSAPRGLGACHGVDLPFLVGEADPWRDAPVLMGADPVVLEDLRNLAADRLMDPARITDRNDPAETWPAYDGDRRASLRIGTVVEPSDVDGSLRALWGIA